MARARRPGQPQQRESGVVVGSAEGEGVVVGLAAERGVVVGEGRGAYHTSTSLPSAVAGYQSATAGLQPISSQQSGMGNQMQSVMVHHPPMPTYQASIQEPPPQGWCSCSCLLTPNSTSTTPHRWLTPPTRGNRPATSSTGLSNNAPAGGLRHCSHGTTPSFPSVALTPPQRDRANGIPGICVYKQSPSLDKLRREGSPSW
ncbi:unnamed protein product [Lota lota]